MRKMKKALAVMLAATMTMSMGMTAFAYVAEEDDGVRVLKTYEVKNGIAPHERFDFTFEFEKFEDNTGKTFVSDEDAATDDMKVYTGVVPNITSAFLNTRSDVATKDGQAVTITADDPLTQGKYTLEDFVEITNLNDCAIGKYYFTAKETSGSNVGVTYATNPLYLVLTVYRDTTGTAGDQGTVKHYIAAMHYESFDGVKNGDGFSNEYNSGSLAITKQITGNLADMEKEFTFTVTFSADAGKNIISAIQNDGLRPYTKSDDGLTYTFTLGDNDTATFTNIPAGTKYVVTEDAENYKSTATYSDNSVTKVGDGDDAVELRTISADDVDTVEFLNTLGATVDTGIALDNAPYILLLALAAFGMFGFVSKKRSMEF